MQPLRGEKSEYLIFTVYIKSLTVYWLKSPILFCLYSLQNEKHCILLFFIGWAMLLERTALGRHISGAEHLKLCEQQYGG